MCGVNTTMRGKDEYINSPYNFNTVLSRQVMRFKKIAI